MAFWQNLKIAIRLGLGIGLVLLLLAVVSGVAYLGLSTGNTHFSHYRSLARQTAAAGLINNDLLTARLSVKDFLLQGSDESVTKVEAAISTMAQDIDNNARILSESDAGKQLLIDVEDDAKAYQDGFNQVVALFKQKEDFVKQLDTLGPKIEGELKTVTDDAFGASNATLTYQAADALRDHFLARVYIDKFMLENAPDEIAQVHDEFAVFDKQIAVLLGDAKPAVDQHLTEDIAKLGKEYATTFDQAEATIISRNDIVANTLNKIGPKMAAQMNDLVTANKAQQDELGPVASAEIEESLITMLIVSGLAIVTGIIMAFLVARSITSPIGSMTTAMGVLAGGNMDAIIPAQGRKDEVGIMAAAVQIFKVNMIEADRLRREQEEAKRLAEEERRRAMLEMADKFENTVGGVVEAVSSAAEELQATAQSMSTTAEETARQSTVVAAASEETTQNVQTVASATEELSASIREIGGQVNESSRIVGTAVAQATDTNAKVRSLAEAAQKIGEVVNLINGIASQTNLLALNATIEAARAGEAGKGFAVVASEVKALATQTAQATDEIGGQIRAIQDATTSSAEAIQDITATVNRVNEISGAIAAAVEEQGAATQEISRNVQEAAQATTEVSSNIVSVTEASRLTGAAATEVLASAGELARNGALLKTQVDAFLREIRS